MPSTSSIAAAILALSSAAVAVPYSSSDASSSSSWAHSATKSASAYTSAYTTKSTATTSAYTTESTSLAALGLSKTQQIFLSDTRVDAINNVLTSNSDFVFNFQKHQTGGPGKGGEVVPANRKTFPALTNTGISAAVAFLGPCGFNTPHVHPRATELAFVVEGTIVSSMFPENGVVNADGTPREIFNTLNEFDTTVYYQGSVHSQFNPNCEPAVFFAALSSEDPGVGQIANELFDASREDATAAVFGNTIDGADVDKLKNSISVNVALGVEQCLTKCGIPKRK
ncbi:RmlC-like cupin domain-containing protein [Xylariales sp. PMI_506]|nr:RmlC-like cupin domain-containing protein [Xylariales sp. PMI_506]